MRWWADPETSLRMLELVDDSDMEQGVATSVLGYHGLVAGALAPLGRQSLVDGGLVQATADGWTLRRYRRRSDVQRSLSLARLLRSTANSSPSPTHARAVDDTTRLIINLASNGLPVPLAVDRAIAVHGVPLQGMGKYAFQMKAPVVAEVVKADLADRALMLWARDVALRERMGGRGLGMTALADISKAAAAMHGDSPARQ